MGTAWLDAFFDACDDCTIDCVAIHIYDSATNEAYFQAYIAGVAAQYGKPVWVTEVRGRAGSRMGRRLIGVVVWGVGHAGPADGVP